MQWAFQRTNTWEFSDEPIVNLEHLSGSIVVQGQQHDVAVGDGPSPGATIIPKYYRQLMAG